MTELLEDRLVPSGVVDSLFVGDVNRIAGSVKQLDAATGAYQTTFVPGDQRLVNPTGMIFGPGHTLLVNDFRYPGVGGEVLKSNGETGYGTAQYFVSGYDAFFNRNPYAPYDPRGICEGPNTTVFVADMGDLGNRDRTNRPGRLTQYKPNGDFMQYLTPTGPLAGPNQVQFDLNNGPRGVVIGPDGDLYVAVRSADGLGGEVMRFDPNTGSFLGDFIDSNATNDLNRPEGLVFGPDGNLYVTSFSLDGNQATTAVTDTDKVLEFDGATGQYLGKIDLDQIGGPRAYAQALLFGPGGKLFVPITGNGPDTGEIRRYDVSSGTYDVFVQPSANGGPFTQPWYLTFGNTDPGTLDYVPAASITTVTSSTSPSVFGQAVTFTATVVVPTRGTPSGAVTFMLDGSTPLGTATLDSSGQATITATGLLVGTHTITAVYSGDAFDAASTSGTFTQTVLSAQQELCLIISQVNAMVAQGVLDPGNGNALISKLNNAIDSLNAGNTVAGENKMDAFLNQVNALSSKQLDSTDVQMLVSEIDLAIDATLTNPI
jgi:hypothetical protein